MSGIKRETIIRVILGICMIVVSIGMIYGKSKAGNANGNDRTYIEESEKTAKQKKAEKSENDSTGSAKQDSTVAGIGHRSKSNCRGRSYRGIHPAGTVSGDGDQQYPRMAAGELF